MTMRGTPVKQRWCIAKSAVLRKEPTKDSEAIAILKFEQCVALVSDKVVNGRVKVSFRPYVKKKLKETTAGWIPLHAISAEPVEDFGNLYYYNRTGRTLVTRNLIGGSKIVGTIAPGEMVQMIAKVGEFCLTNKGWTMFRYFRWKREIIDATAASMVFVAVIEQAIKDYKLVVKKLREGKWKRKADFIDAMNEFERLRRWITSNKYSNMIDPVDGAERLADLDADCGIDEKWIKEKRFVKQSIDMHRGKRL